MIWVQGTSSRFTLIYSPLFQSGEFRMNSKILPSTAEAETECMTFMWFTHKTHVTTGPQGTVIRYNVCNLDIIFLGT